MAESLRQAQLAEALKRIDARLDEEVALRESRGGSAVPGTPRASDESLRTMLAEEKVRMQREEVARYAQFEVPDSDGWAAAVVA